MRHTHHMPRSLRPLPLPPRTPPRLPTPTHTLTTLSARRAGPRAGAVAPPRGDGAVAGVQRAPDAPPPVTTASSPPQEAAADRSAWFKAWHPIAAVENLDPAKPNALELMGERLVAWQPAPGAAWVVQADRCPHRAAPLTDGFVSRGGEIVCAYHGYRFGATGACTAVTALSHDGAAEATARTSRRACVRTLPAREVAGLLFAWPDPASSDPHADAEAAPPPPVPFAGFEDVLPKTARWYERYLPYDMGFHLENVLDPGHPFFAHHGVAGMDAAAAVDMELEVVQDRGAAGFSVRMKQPGAPSAGGLLIHFDAPCLVRYEPDVSVADAAGSATGRGHVDAHLTFYSAPVRPGWTVHFSASSFVDRDTGKAAKVGSMLACTDFMPAWARHVVGHKFVAGDQVSMARATVAYAREGRNWRSSYWLPSSADLGVVLFRRWMETHGGGPDIPQLPPSVAGHGIVAPAADTLGVTPAEVALDSATVEVLLDRYNQHTRHCASCRKALANSRTVAVWARALAIAAALAAFVLVTAAAQAALATTSAGGWTNHAALAVLRATHGTPLAAVVGCAAVASVAVAVAFAARVLERKFYYEPFDREEHKFV